MMVTGLCLRLGLEEIDKIRGLRGSFRQMSDIKGRIGYFQSLFMGQLRLYDIFM